MPAFAQPGMEFESGCARNSESVDTTAACFISRAWRLLVYPAHSHFSMLRYLYLASAGRKFYNGVADAAKVFGIWHVYLLIMQADYSLR
ncbi:MAG: hypothetical protein KDK04_11735 [Candidatus Competibacteraceae bacterium]|nr:hypothetical protein [Candidatus Competibacteraceae bacterium]MCB1812373.1 hypothetical protein [Candidatus Competibacteraceae bacterium]